MLRRSPTLAVTIIATLGIALAATVLVFSLLNSFLLRPLPYGDAARLVVIFEYSLKGGRDNLSRVTYGNFTALQERATAFARLGLFRNESATFQGGEGTETAFLQRVTGEIFPMMGVRAAHRYFLTAERFGAQEALRIGLVHEVVAADQLDRKVGELAQALVQAGPQAVKACKKLLHDVGGHEITAGLVQRTVEGIADIRASDEAREGVQSFLGKRKPNWLLG